MCLLDLGKIVDLGHNQVLGNLLGLEPAWSCTNFNQLVLAVNLGHNQVLGHRWRARDLASQVPLWRTWLGWPLGQVLRNLQMFRWRATWLLRPLGQGLRNRQMFRWRASWLLRPLGQALRNLQMARWRASWLLRWRASWLL